MTRPLPLAAFDRLPPVTLARVVDGLSGAIDAVAARAAEPARFLRYGWYAAAVAADRGHPRTVLVEEGGMPVLAMPLVALGPAVLGAVQVPGSYWPFRSVPLALEAGPAAAAAALRALPARALRLGPVPDGDPAATALIAAARANGWTVLDRAVGQGWMQDLGNPAWPRASSLKKNRFHEKHLAAHGALDWRTLGAAHWPAAFDRLAAVERASWIASDTDGADAKFAAGPHRRFWQAVTADPVLASCCSAALLTIDGRPAAFSFDLDVGTTRYAIANSYDPAFAKHSPGKLLQYRSLLAARARGIATVDWGMGDSGYKAVLGAVAGPILRDWLLLRPGVTALVGRRIAARAGFAPERAMTGK